MLFRIIWTILNLLYFHIKFFQFLWRIELEFWWGLCWICWLFLVGWAFSCLVLPIHEHKKSFQLMVSSSMFFSILTFTVYKSFTSLVRLISRYICKLLRMVCFFDFVVCLSFVCRKTTNICLNFVSYYFNECILSDIGAFWCSLWGFYIQNYIICTYRCFGVFLSYL